MRDDEESLLPDLADDDESIEPLAFAEETTPPPPAATTEVGPLLAASIALARLDERLRAAPAAVRTGWSTRALLAEAAASAGLDGDSVDPATLRLAEAGGLAETPSPALSAALTRLSLVRAGAARSPQQMFTPRRLIVLARLRLPQRPEGESESESEEDDRIPLWLRDRRNAPETLRLALERAFSPEITSAWRRQPPLLGAAALLRIWRDSGCEELLGGAPGRVLAAAWLRRQGLVQGPWFLPSLGFRGQAAAWAPAAGPVWPAAFCTAALRSAEWGLALHHQLILARDDLLRTCAGRRENSRLPQLVDLFLARPALTSGTAAQALSITRRAASGMIETLRDRNGALIRELSGRNSFRIYGVA